MFKVEAHYKTPGHDNPHVSDWQDTGIVEHFIRNMWSHGFISHFVVTGPEWSCIVRPKPAEVKPVAKTPQELQDGMPF